METTFTFTENQMKPMAQFIAQLIREGVTYKVRRDEMAGLWMIELTGGY